MSAAATLLALNNNSATKKSKGKQSGEARAPSAYNLFMKDHLPVVKEANPALSHKEAFTKAAGDWATSELNPKREENLAAAAAKAARGGNASAEQPDGDDGVLAAGASGGGGGSSAGAKKAKAKKAKALYDGPPEQMKGKRKRKRTQNDEQLQAALAILKRFKYDVFDACAGGAQVSSAGDARRSNRVFPLAL